MDGRMNDSRSYSTQDASLSQESAAHLEIGATCGLSSVVTSKCLLTYLNRQLARHSTNSITQPIEIQCRYLPSFAHKKPPFDLLPVSSSPNSLIILARFPSHDCATLNSWHLLRISRIRGFSKPTRTKGILLPRA